MFYRKTFTVWTGLKGEKSHPVNLCSTMISLETEHSNQVMVLREVVLEKDTNISRGLNIFKYVD